MVSPHGFPRRISSPQIPPGRGVSCSLRRISFSACEPWIPPTNTPLAYTNLTQSYGLLHTIAGSGADAGVDGVNYWQTNFEGGYATNAALSRPHFAVADNAGNIFIVENDIGYVRKIDFQRLTP
jgi:hypothetical protein